MEASTYQQHVFVGKICQNERNGSIEVSCREQSSVEEAQENDLGEVLKGQNRDRMVREYSMNQGGVSGLSIQSERQDIVHTLSPTLETVAIPYRVFLSQVLDSASEETIHGWLVGRKWCQHMTLDLADNVRHHNQWGNDDLSAVNCGNGGDQTHTSLVEGDRERFDDRGNDSGVDPTKDGNLEVQTGLEASLPIVTLEPLDELEHVRDDKVQQGNRNGTSCVAPQIGIPHNDESDPYDTQGEKGCRYALGKLNLYAGVCAREKEKGRVITQTADESESGRLEVMVVHSFVASFVRSSPRDCTILFCHTLLYPYH